MAFTWTDNMRSVGSKPELEDATRTAVIAAITFLDGRKAEDERPHFDGAQWPVAKNDAAKAMKLECTKHLPTTLTGVERETVVRTALAAAFLVQRNGGGEAGCAALAKTLTKTAAKKPG